MEEIYERDPYLNLDHHTDSQELKDTSHIHPGSGFGLLEGS